MGGERGHLGRNFRCKIADVNKQILTDYINMKRISVKYDQSFIRCFSSYI